MSSLGGAKSPSRGCKIPAEGVQMPPLSLFLKALPRAASEAYAFNDKQGGRQLCHEVALSSMSFHLCAQLPYHAGKFLGYGRQILQGKSNQPNLCANCRNDGANTQIV